MTTTPNEQPTAKPELTQEQIKQEFATRALASLIDLLIDIGGFEFDDEDAAAREAANNELAKTDAPGA